MENLDSTLFPGISDDIYVHSGFAAEQVKTAAIVLAETETLIQQTGADTVVLVSSI